jgi:hypothetical protein
MRFFVLTVFILIFAAAGFSQTAVQDDEDIQSWNDLQITVPLSKSVDFFTKFTMRLGKNITRATDERIAVGYVWKPVRNLSISPFYWYVRARNSAGFFRVENRLSLSATYRFPIKRFGLSHRSTYEKRMRRPVDSWRYRAMVTVDKDIPKHIIPNTKAFVSDEVFYDSATRRFSRNRFSIGITKTITKHLSLDLYYTRQNDGFTHPGDLNIIWTAWKVRL